MTKIITAVPTRGLIYTAHQNALERELFDNGQVPFIVRTDNMPIPDSRNYLLDEALKLTWWSHILLVDDDIVIPKGGLSAMLDLNTDVAVIDYPYHVIGEKDGEEQMYGTAVYDDWESGESTEGKKLAWAGLGCVLVRRHVFEEMQKPFFKSTEYKYVRKNKIIHFSSEVGYSEDLRKEFAGGGEDTHFYLEARRANAEIKSVPGMVATHLRTERIVSRMANSRYVSQHKITGNSRIDTPLQ